jgi:hypothetical protein
MTITVDHTPALGQEYRTRQPVSLSHDKNMGTAFQAA